MKKGKSVLFSEIEFRRTCESDCPSIASLVNRTSSLGTVNIEAEYYQNTYFNNPAGKGISFVAKHHGQLVAHFCVLPKKYLIGNRESVIGKTMDMFTDSNYQRLGLSTTLAKMAFEQALKENISFFYVTPSIFSAPIFLNKFGFQEPFTFLEYWYLINPKEIMSKKIRLPFVNSLASSCYRLWHTAAHKPSHKQYGFLFQKVDSLPEEVNLLWRNIESSYSITQVKDIDYLKWRYITNPIQYVIYFVKKNDCLKGILVLRLTTRHGTKMGIIIDLIYDRNQCEVYEAMMAFSRSYFEEQGCTLGLAWGTGTRKSRKMFGKHYFYPFVYGIRPLKRSPRRILIKSWSDNEDNSLFFSHDDWSFCIGDGNDY